MRPGWGCGRGTKAVSVKCRWCGWRAEYTEVGKGLGRCSTCKSSRWMGDGPREGEGPKAPEVVCGCGKWHPQLTARVRSEVIARDEAYADHEAHVQHKHHAAEVATRMHEIEQHYAYERRHHGEEDWATRWATDEQAVEYRALLREWWALPSIPQEAWMASPSRRRTLTGKGLV